MKYVCLLMVLSAQLYSANTSILFQPALPSVGPFPTNALTSPDPTQKTGVRVSLPLPSGCTVVSTSTDCINAELENQLDGFSVNPRIELCFSGPIDVTTLTAAVSITPVGSAGPSVAINQIIFDPKGNCAYAKPDQVLNQDTQYLLTVTSALSDADGKRLKSDKNFDDCVKQGETSYCEALSTAVGQFTGKSNGNPAKEVISASLFTTMSATAWMEKTRAQINSPGFPELATPAGFTSTFSLASVKSITYVPQNGVAPSRALPLNVLEGVDKVSFGLFLSPIYLNLSGPQAGTISTTPTGLPNSGPNAVFPVSFHVFLPPAKNGQKFPVIIYGHGLGDDQFGASTYVAATFAKKGFATLSMEITGHGYGLGGTTQVVANNTTYTELTPGRGIQLSPPAPIGPTDGCILPTALATRDCSRQTAADLIALIRNIRDTNGLGLNLDRSRIYYVGQSFGSFYGTVLEAVEPTLSAGTLNAGGGTQAEVARLSPIARTLGALYLSTFSPSLLNVPPAPSEAYFHDSFNDEYVYRGQAISDTVPGALDIQAAFESADWLGMLGDPLSYAGHLKTAPLAGVPAKKILVQFGVGDLEVPNPTESALVRAAGLQDTTWVLNTVDVAALEPADLGLLDPTKSYPIYPHRFLSNPTLFGSYPLETAIAVAAQSQIGDFFNSGTPSDPNLLLPTPPNSLPPFFQLQNSVVTPLDMLNFFQFKP